MSSLLASIFGTSSETPTTPTAFGTSESEKKKSSEKKKKGKKEKKQKHDDNDDDNDDDAADTEKNDNNVVNLFDTKIVIPEQKDYPSRRELTEKSDKKLQQQKQATTKKKRKRQAAEEAAAAAARESIFADNDHGEDEEDEIIYDKPDDNDDDEKETTPKNKKDKQNNKETGKKDGDNEKEDDAADAAADALEQKKRADREEQKTRTVYVGNLPLEMTNKQLLKLFKEHETLAGEKVEAAYIRGLPVLGVKLPEHEKGNQKLMKKVCVIKGLIDKNAPKSSVFGYVVFRNKDSIEQALKLNNTVVDGRHITVSRVVHVTTTTTVDGSEQQHQQQATFDPSRSVFVGNLPWKTDEESLREHFLNVCDLEEPPEQIEGIRVVRDKETHQCKGFAYVLFQNKACVALALVKGHGSVYMGKELRVQVCGKQFRNKKGEKKQRWKSNRGGENDDDDAKEKQAKATGALRRLLVKEEKEKVKHKREKLNKMKRFNMSSSNITKSNSKTATNAGVSKRAAKQSKAKKVAKKMEKRMTKGMGKNKSSKKGNTSSS